MPGLPTDSRKEAAGNCAHNQLVNSEKHLEILHFGKISGIIQSLREFIAAMAEVVRIPHRLCAPSFCDA